MSSRDNHAIHEQIQALLESWACAVREKDIEAIMACYDPEVIAYDAIIQLQFKGREAYRKHWQYCLDMCQGPMLFEQHELVVHGDGSVAFAHWLNHCGTADEQGQLQGSWMRGSAAYRLSNGGWRIVHEHFSAPFDMESGKALFDLQP